MTINELISKNIDRADMTREEELLFVNHWFDLYEKAGFRETFSTPYEDNKNYTGGPFTVLRRETELSVGLSRLPMWRIAFSDGHEISAYPEEICRLDESVKSLLCFPDECTNSTLLENSATFPCSSCWNSTSTEGIRFACPRRIASLLVADIDNGPKKPVVGTTEVDHCSRYFKLAQKDDRCITVNLTRCCPAPGLNESPFYMLHIVDDIRERDGEIIDCDELDELSVRLSLEHYVKQAISSITAEQQSSKTKYLLQIKHPDGTVSAELYFEQQIIDLYGFRDCSSDEYEVYDISIFGRALKLEEKSDSFGEPNYHRFCLPKSLGGSTVFSGFSPEH